jgi:hypothetical protein
LRPASRDLATQIHHFALMEHLRVRLGGRVAPAPSGLAAETDRGRRRKQQGVGRGRGCGRARGLVSSVLRATAVFGVTRS